MKVLGVSLFILALVCSNADTASGSKQCTPTKPKDNDKWRDMNDDCITALSKQVRKEVQAALTYMAMGAHFAQDSVNRPGFSKFFFESASEEREHAIKIMEYLLMRGQLNTNVSGLLDYPLKPTEHYWADGLTALRRALETEVDVTKSIRHIMTICEKPPSDELNNDYHLVDYLTADFLDEQYKGERLLAGRVSTLGTMMENDQHLAEFIFDKKLLFDEL